MPDHPPPMDLRSATQILKQTAAIFSVRHHLRIFLLISFLLLSFRFQAETVTYYLTSFIDNDHSLKSVLTRTELPENPTTPTTSAGHHHRRRPFLQLSRVGTLDDDFFTGDEELNQRLYGSLPKIQWNATSFMLDSFDPQSGFSNFVSDNGIRVSETVRSGAKLSFRSIDTNDSVTIDTIDDKNTEIETNFELLLKRFDLEHHEFTVLLVSFGALSASYCLMIFQFVFTYACIHGIIFVLVVNEILKNYSSFKNTLSKGSILGLKRLSGFIIMKWVVRDALTQVLGVWFFGGIEDQYSIFKIFVRLKFMPFSIFSPWVKGYEREIYFFLISWFLLDVILSFIFAVDSWVSIVDSRKSGKEVIKEGFHLLSLKIHPAINLICLEGIVCGPFARFILTQSFGKLLAISFQSIMEVYFMVVWMLYYFSVKSIDANSKGLSFGRRELEAMVKDV